MKKSELKELYNNYLACLNAQDWVQLGTFVHDDVSHNGKRIGLSGYRALLENDFVEIPDLYFQSTLIISAPPHIAARLEFDCHPKGVFLGLPINGKRVKFAENVFYEMKDRQIWNVWSVVDKAAIEAQL